MRRALVLSMLCALLTVPGDRSPASASFPGDNGRIAFSLHDGLAGSLIWAPGSVVPNAHVASPGVSGPIYFVRNRRAIVKVDAPGGAETVINKSDLYPRSPSASPDGSRIAFVEYDDPSSSASFILAIGWDASPPDPPTGVAADLIADSPSWSLDGSHIAAQWNTGVGPGPDPDYASGIASVTSDGSGVVDELIYPGLKKPQATFHLSQPSWSSTDVIVYRKCCWRADVRGRIFAGAIYSYDVNTEAIVPLTTTARVRTDSHPDVSPDGSKILFTRRTVRGTDLYTMDIDGTNVAKLTRGNDKRDWDGVFSPDGSKIVYVRCCFGTTRQSDLFVMNADGTGRVRLTDTKAQEAQPSWGVLPA